MRSQGTRRAYAVVRAPGSIEAAFCSWARRPTFPSQSLVVSADTRTREQGAPGATTWR